MTTLDIEPDVDRTPTIVRTHPRPAPRQVETDWPTTCLDRKQAWQLLNSAPLTPSRVDIRHPNAYPTGVGLLLDWLADQPGQTWQQRWIATGADADGRCWRQIPAQWLREHGHPKEWLQYWLFRALLAAIAADLIRPSLSWLVTAAFRRGTLLNVVSGYRDPDGFARLRALCSADSDINAAAANRTTNRAALILAAKGGTLADITPGDVLALFDVEADTHATSVGATHLFYRVLHALGGFGAEAPATLRELRAAGQRSPEELIDRYELVCQPIRNLLVDYLRERQPALDYTSLDALAHYLGGLFWSDLERHHPGISSLHLSAEVASAWKQRLRTITKVSRGADGKTVRTTAERVNYRKCLTPVRAFYLDLACWAAEDPARWGPWVVPCPVGAEEVNQRRDKRRRKSRMDARTRERLPVLPVLVRDLDERRKTAAALLDAARRTEPGQQFSVAEQTLTRIRPGHSAAAKIWVQEPQTGKRRDLGWEEDRAFWTFAAVEVLRSTGIRIEELTELSHHSLVQYRLPSTGEMVPLLQITPSKTDAERLLVVSPELAEVLSAIINRVRGATGAIPLVRAYDKAERNWSPPLPLLFQRRVGFEHRAISSQAIRRMLTAAIDHTRLTDPAAGEPLRFTPHDFRRLFITDAVLNGVPPHIAQVIAGHRDINVTLGYKAVYPDEAIQSHLAFLARRRALRPTDEYRQPTDEEWQRFLGHFERRKVSIGTCGRAFGTPCIHEHACVRCALLWPDPAQRSRLVEICDNLQARIAEAEREGWLGEVEGLQVSLAGAKDKLAQLDRRSTNTTDLAIPTVTNNNS
ncbi:MAG TPA: site-specific integrase [Mycobacterium sp.]